MNIASSVLRSTSSLATQLAKRCSIKQCHQATITTSIRIPRVNIPLQNRSFFSSDKRLDDHVHVEVSKVQASSTSKAESGVKEIKEDNMTGIEEDHAAEVEDDEMEQEEMFVSPDISLGTDKVEWGGPRRGGRLAEPTRFGDWERKGRCTDF